MSTLVVVERHPAVLVTWCRCRGVVAAAGGASAAAGGASAAVPEVRRRHTVHSLLATLL